MILTTIFLSGCGKADMAAVEDHRENFYSRNGVLSLNGAAAAQPLAAVQPVAIESEQYLVQAPAKASTWQWPVAGQVVETFGEKSDGIANEGIVISSNEGTPIKAAQAGEVAFVGKDTKTYGNIVILRHADGDMSSYAHAREITVTKGQQVAAGAALGTVGQSGSAKSPQLHFAVRESGASIDPMTKLPRQIASN